MSAHRSWVLATIVALAALGGGLALWWPAPTQDTLARARSEGVIRIGYAVEAPYAFLSARGEPTGESVELARIVARRLGIARVEWSQTEFGSLIPELLVGRFDVIAAGMFITRERAEWVVFSEPTLRVAPGFLVPAHNPQGLRSYEDLRQHPDLRVAALQGSVEEAALRRLGLDDTRLLRVPDALTGRVAVENGVVHALVLSLPTLREMVRKRGKSNLEVAAASATADAGIAPVGFVGFAFRPADAALRTAWNGSLKGYVGSAQHLALLQPFGLGAADLPAERTTAQILAEHIQ